MSLCPEGLSFGVSEMARRKALILTLLLATICIGGSIPVWAVHAEQGGLISNVSVANGKGYEVDTFTAGQLVYIDRTYTYTAAYPRELEGQEYIRTANNDKTGTGISFLTFELTAAAASLEFLVSLPLFWTFAVGRAGFQNFVSIAWIPDWGIAYSVGVDGISILLILLTTLLLPICVLLSWEQVKEKERAYYAMLLILGTGMLGVFVALDLFLFYIFWEVTLIPMYFLVGVWGHERRIYAAVKFFLYTAFGSLLMLVAILVLFWLHQDQFAEPSLAYADMIRIQVPAGLQYWLFAAFALAFAIKVPVFPFHTWLPDAHVEAPTAGSVLLAAVLLKMGIYGFLRFAIPLFMKPGARSRPRSANRASFQSPVIFIVPPLFERADPKPQRTASLSASHRYHNRALRAPFLAANSRNS